MRRALPKHEAEYRDVVEAARLRKKGRPELVVLGAAPCVYCGLKATRGIPPTCWEHRDLADLDGPYGGVFL